MNSALLAALSSVVPLLADMALKGALLLALAGLTTAALWRASAALRHMIWSLTMVGLIALPLLSALLPQWRVLPQWFAISGEEESAVTNAEPAQPIVPAPQPEQALTSSMPAPMVKDTASVAPMALVETAPSPTATEPAPVAAAAAPSLPVPSAERETIPVSLWLCASWLLGGAMILLYVLLGRFALWRTTRSAQTIGGGAWTTLLQSLAERLRLRRKVTLLRSERPVMPMTWGIRRARILLPGQSDSWPAERRRAVLLHEMAHVRRWDCLTQLLTNLACAMHWFNPLVWIARRRIIAESECACDDLVLAAGFDPSDYAQHLLQIASGLRSGHLTSAAAIAMARPSKLEGRLLAVLDTKRSRRALTRFAFLICVLAILGLALPLAALRAAAADAEIELPVKLAGLLKSLIALCPRKLNLLMSRRKCKYCARMTRLLWRVRKLNSPYLLPIQNDHPGLPK